MRYVLPLLAMQVLWSGCAAGRASVALINAQKSVNQADQRGAAEHAAFEFTMAEAYLTKAREEASFSDYKTSVELAHDASEWADKSVITMATQGRGDTVPEASAPKAPLPDGGSAPTGSTTLAPDPTGDTAETGPVAPTPPAQVTPAQVTPAEGSDATPAEPKESPMLVAYRDALQNQIAGAWQIPDGAAAAPPQNATQLTVIITSSGDIESARVSQRSGLNDVDISLLQALNKAAPFPPPPQSLRNDEGKLSVPGLTFKVPGTPGKVQVIDKEAGQ